MTSKGYCYKKYNNGKIVRISQKLFNKKNKQIGGSKPLYEKGDIVECITEKCFKSDEDVSFINKGITNTSTGTTSFSTKLKVVDFKIVFSPLKHIIYTLEYKHKGTTKTIEKEQKFLRKWKPMKITRINDEVIRNLNLRDENIPNYYASAHGHEKYVFLKDSLNIDLDNLFSKFTIQVDEFVKEVYGQELPNILKSFIDKKVKILRNNKSVYSIFFDKNTVNNIHNFIYESKDYIEKYLLIPDMGKFYVMEIVIAISDILNSNENIDGKAQNILEKSYEILEEFLENLDNEAQKYRDFEKISIDIKNDFLEIIDEYRESLIKEQTDIILEPGQKVIISCDAACTMRENPHGIKENMYIDTFLNEVAGKKDSYCVHENRVPNIFLQFASNFGEPNTNMRGVFELPIIVKPGKKMFLEKKIRMTGINYRVLDLNNIKSWKQFTGKQLYDGRYEELPYPIKSIKKFFFTGGYYSELSTVIDKIKKNLKNKKDPFVLFLIACRSAEVTNINEKTTKKKNFFSSIKKI